MSGCGGWDPGRGAPPGAIMALRIMTAPPAFVFAETAPDARLAPWVLRYWEFRVHADQPHLTRDNGTTWNQFMEMNLARRP